MFSYALLALLIGDLVVSDSRSCRRSAVLVRGSRLSFRWLSPGDAWMCGSFLALIRWALLHARVVLPGGGAVRALSDVR